MRKEDLKIGDKVLLKNRRGKLWNSDGLMDEYIGKIVTINRIFDDRFTIQEDNKKGDFGDWVFNCNDIEKKVTDLKLEDLEFADILTLRNGQKYVLANGHMFGYNGHDDFDCYYVDNAYNDDLTSEDRNSDFDIVKVERYGQAIYEREKAVKKMTVSEICKELGYDVEIVKENENE